MISHRISGKAPHWCLGLILSCCGTLPFSVSGKEPVREIKSAYSAKHATTDQFRVHGLSRFNTSQQATLRQWLRAGVNATRATLGIYPKPIDLFVYPRPSDQPVPWAHTRRDEPESVHFYVDSRFSADEFIADWTIYHELAHLAIPYVGQDYAWFSEGFASYMQYQIMAQNGQLKMPLAEAYRSKIAPHLRWFQVDVSAAAIAQNLMKKRNFPAAYWGGAWFFVLAEHKLLAAGHPALKDVIQAYQACCHDVDHDIRQLLSALDQIIAEPLLLPLLDAFEQQAARTFYPITYSLN